MRLSDCGFFVIKNIVSLKTSKSGVSTPR